MSEKWIPEIMTPLKQDIVKCQRLFGKPVALKFYRKIKSIILRQILRLSAIRMHRQ